MAFHGTLTYWGQQVDELPMVWYLLACLLVINGDTYKTPRKKNLAILGLVVYATAFSALHLYRNGTTSFQVHFLCLALYVLYRMYYKYIDVFMNLEPNLAAIPRCFITFTLSAGACWLIDYHACPYFLSDICIFNPHGHVWWHLLMGRAAYYSVVMIKVVDDTHHGRYFDLRYDNLFRLPMSYRQKHPIEIGERSAEILPSLKKNFKVATVLGRGRRRTHSDSIV